ncbi:MAG: hypothetical protein KUG69_05855 [Marinosulfonomonas sp.]|nr:hypothetical protein [Marinosulfonomonas sp.]
MRWTIAALIAFFSQPAQALEQTEFECSMSMACTAATDCSMANTLEISVKKAADHWLVTSWYGSAPQIKLDTKYTEIAVPIEQHNDLYLMSISEFAGGIDVTMLSLHESGSAFYSNHIGGDIPTPYVYFGQCMDPI